MKNLFTATICLLLTALIATADTGLSKFRGVWASGNAEAVITDSICLLFSKGNDGTLTATLSIPEINFNQSTTFIGDSVITKQAAAPSLDLSSKTQLTINGTPLSLIETLTTREPYEPKRCTAPFLAGKCLQEWRLGATWFVSDDGQIYTEVNTNRHMFIYAIMPQMVYIRAAATRNNDHGTLFHQNIRMMKNLNSGEYTSVMEENHYPTVTSDLEIDNSRFLPDQCFFSPDGGIYWSVIDTSPDTIRLNGCGETYTVDRPTPATNPDREWFEFVEY